MMIRKAIKTAMWRQGVSVRELSYKANVSATTLYKFLGEKKYKRGITEQPLERIMRTLHLTISPHRTGREADTQEVDCN